MELEERVAQLEYEVAELKEALRFLVLTTSYQENPRLPFTKFCSQNFIAGDKYTELYGYLINLEHQDLEDLDSVYATMNKAYGVPRGQEEVCLRAFQKQCPRD